MIRYASVDTARQAAAWWGGQGPSVGHLSDSGNSVFSFQHSGTRSILRLTDPSFRTRDQLEAETDFLLHLVDAGIRVGGPLPSSNGRLVEEVRGTEGVFLVTAFTWAPGVVVDETSPFWTRELLLEWGRTLAKIHDAASTYRPRVSGRRWSWDQEVWMAQATTLIPVEDSDSRTELHRVLEHLQQLPKSSTTFGLVHGDLGPQNFRLEPETGRITVFDFGNCCYHWFLSDLATSLTVLSGSSHRGRLREWLLQGYESVRPFEAPPERSLDWLIRLRVLYVYLSRLYKFGLDPSPEEREILDRLRSRVHRRKGW